MKLISLNTWGGRAGREKLLGFFEAHKDADVFCPQEVIRGYREEHEKHVEGKTAAGHTLENFMFELYGDVSRILSEHDGYFRPHFHEFYGLAIFVKKNITLIEEGELFVHRDRWHMPVGDLGNHARNIQHVTLETPAGKCTIVNFHGLWNGQGKGDSEDRLRQSEKVLGFLKTISNPFVLCGDFNLLPETESFKKIRSFGLKNLIAEFGITSTRSSLYAKPNRYADYALVSDGIEVHEFRTLPDEVSDHLALYLDFE